MKTKLNLILTLITPLLLLNCSGKTTPQQSIPNTQINNRGLLGQSVSNPIEHVITQPPVTQQPVEHGKSTLFKKVKLSNTIKESSGLIKIDGKLWTLNDSGGRAELYQIDEQNGKIVKSIKISNARNKDWEDIAYDDTYVYIGDFGNNRGNRKDLKIYMIPRADLRTQTSTRAEVINFTYSDQKNFKSRAQKNNFDCEAMVAHNGKLYLFSKNWKNEKTRLYELETTAGKHVAQYKRTFNTRGMVTGATVNEELDILLLTTYNQLLSVGIWSFTNYGNGLFFDGVAKALTIDPLMSQVEGITFIDNYKAYLSSEAFRKYIFSVDATLYELNFSGEFE